MTLLGRLDNLRKILAHAAFDLENRRYKEAQEHLSDAELTTLELIETLKQEVKQ